MVGSDVVTKCNQLTNEHEHFSPDQSSTKAKWSGPKYYDGPWWFTYWPSGCLTQNEFLLRPHRQPYITQVNFFFSRVKNTDPLIL